MVDESCFNEIVPCQFEFLNVRSKELKIFVRTRNIASKWVLNVKMCLNDTSN